MTTIKNYFVDWKKFEIVWLFIASLSILTLSISFGDSTLVLLSSLAGAITVVLCAKGKISFLYFALFQCLTYSYIAFNHQIYGEFMLNLFFVFPTNIITLYLWRKNSKKENEIINGEDVVMKKLSLKQWIILMPIIIISTFAYGYVLELINARQAYLDSLAVVLTIFAQFLMMFRYAEQWILWIVINVITIGVWTLVLLEDGTGSIGVLVMWLIFLINSVWGYVNWSKVAK